MRTLHIFSLILLHNSCPTSTLAPVAHLPSGHFAAPARPMRLCAYLDEESYTPVKP